MTAVRPTSRRVRHVLGATLTALSLVALTACGSGPARSPSGGASTAATQAAVSTHIHAIARDPRGEVLLATHQGLFRVTDGGLHQQGPIIDLMGFAVAPDGTMYASGHPGSDVDLPQPVGLISSTDGGNTWQVLSRGGESDFHALAAGPTAVTGFDGALRTTVDRTNWTTRQIPDPPRVLAASPGTGRLLATTRAGMLVSDDDGATWASLTPPEPALLVDWVDDTTIVALTTSGRLMTSNDRGVTWTLHPGPLGDAESAEAIHAHRSTDGQVEAIVAFAGTVLRTSDYGVTTADLLR